MTQNFAPRELCIKLQELGCAPECETYKDWESYWNRHKNNIKQFLPSDICIGEIGRENSKKVFGEEQAIPSKLDQKSIYQPHRIYYIKNPGGFKYHQHKLIDLPDNEFWGYVQMHMVKR